MQASYRILLVITILFCHIVPGIAQSVEQTLTGTVVDENRQPLQGAVIRCGKYGTVSGANGQFTLQIPAAELPIEVSYTGYEPQRIAPANFTEVIQLRPSENQLSQVVVSAGKYSQEIKRVTVSTDIIKPYLIENKMTVNMEHIMNQVPGVNIVDGQANIRGGSGWTYGAGSRVLVMLDELPFITGDANQVQWKFLPTENIEQMEVIKGASSVLYGSSALNGVINIRTAKPSAKPKTSFTLFGGFFDQLKRDSSRWNQETQFQRGFSAYDSRRIKRLDLTTQMHYLKDDGYRLGEKDHRFRGTLLTNYRPKRIPGLSFGVNASWMETQAQSFLLWENWSYAYTAQDSNTTDSRSRNISIDPHIDFERYGFRHRYRSRLLFTRNDITSEDTTVNQDNSSSMLYNEYQVQKDLPKQFGTITAGLATMFVNSDAALYNGTHSSQNIAPYLQIDLRYKRLSLSTGIRYESFKIENQSEGKTIYRAGISLEATRSTFIRASYGEGYRFPSIAERFITTSAGIINIFPNPNLQSETGWNAELGVRQGFKIGGWSGLLDVAYFHTEYQNMVEFNFGQWAPIDFNNPTTFTKAIGFKSLNIGSTRITGLDASVTGTGKIGPCLVRTLIGYTYMNPVSLSPTDTFIVDVSGTNGYTYRNTSSDTVNDVLKYRYQHLAKADIEVSYGKWSLGYSLRFNSYMQNVDAIFTSEQVVPGITEARKRNRNGDWVMDARLSYQITKQFKANLLVNNLTNYEYMSRPADMRPPRLWMVQLNYLIQ